MRTINILGCGKVGMTLGFLLYKNNCCRIQGILTQSLQSSQRAKNFIGDGFACASLQDLQPADIFLLATTDDHLPNIIAKLTASTIIRNNPIIFHCSGALSSALLSPLQAQGAHIASLHPVKSFSRPEDDIHNFVGTTCTVEGDLKACKILKEIFTQLGANMLQIQATKKLSYHIALVLSSNYLVSLIDTSLRLLEEAGIDKQQGTALLQPLVMGSWQQLVKWGCQEALTGPIARGDSELVATQLALLQEFDMEIADAYQALGKLTLKLIEKKNSLPRDALHDLENLFRTPRL